MACGVRGSVYLSLFFLNKYFIFVHCIVLFSAGWMNVCYGWNKLQHAADARNTAQVQALLRAGIKRSHMDNYPSKASLSAIQIASRNVGPLCQPIDDTLVNILVLAAGPYSLEAHRVYPEKFQQVSLK